MYCSTVNFGHIKPLLELQTIFTKRVYKTLLEQNISTKVKKKIKILHQIEMATFDGRRNQTKVAIQNLQNVTRNEYGRWQVPNYHNINHNHMITEDFFNCTSQHLHLLFSQSIQLIMYNNIALLNCHTMRVLKHGEITKTAKTRRQDKKVKIQSWGKGSRWCKGLQGPEGSTTELHPQDRSAMSVSPRRRKWPLVGSGCWPRGLGPSLLHLNLSCDKRKRGTQMLQQLWTTVQITHFPPN